MKTALERDVAPDSGDSGDRGAGRTESAGPVAPVREWEISPGGEAAVVVPLSGAGEERERGRPPDGVQVQRWAGVALLIVALPLLFWKAGPENSPVIAPALFLPFHTAVEVFAVVVAAMIFAAGWHAYELNNRRSGALTILACAFLAVASFDLIHLLSYHGMPDFVTPNSPHKAIVFWLAARLLAAAALLVYVALPKGLEMGPRTRLGWLIGSLLLVAAVGYVGVHHVHWIPATFVPGQGLTPFKIGAEAVVVALHLATLAVLFLRRRAMSGPGLPGLMLAVGLMAAAELFFMVYAEVSDTANALGHLYKIIAYLFLYQAIFLTTLRAPFMELIEARRKLLDRERSHRELQLDLEHRSTRDFLTDLPNRQLLRDRLQHAIVRAERDRGRLAVLFIDLDRFKNVNDTLGHDTGDCLLQRVAWRINSAVRASDTVARVGGDEFVVVLEDADDAGEGGDAAAVARKVLAALATPVVVEGRELPVSASIGIARFPQDAYDAATLLRKAETAMHRVKESGSGSFGYYYSGMNAHTNARLYMEVQLKRAVAREEFVLRYQPKVEARDGRVVGAEALIRWREPRQGRLVSPGEFIPLLEESGLIIPVSEWVVAEVLSVLRRWRELGIGVPLAVNVSAKQFQQEGAFHQLRQALRDSAAEGRMLQLEVTESLIIADPERAIRALQAVREMGVTTALDDFGTGYSSLTYLKRLPIDVLKLDGSFVRGLPDDPEDAAIARTVIGLGQALDMRVVAERVETEEQADFLREEGCDELQGYLFSRPLALDRFEQLLAKPGGQ